MFSLPTPPVTVNGIEYLLKKIGVSSDTRMTNAYPKTIRIFLPTSLRSVDVLAAVRLMRFAATFLHRASLSTLPSARAGYLLPL